VHVADAWKPASFDWGRSSSTLPVPSPGPMDESPPPCSVQRQKEGTAKRLRGPGHEPHPVVASVQRHRRFLAHGQMVGKVTQVWGWLWLLLLFHQILRRNIESLFVCFVPFLIKTNIQFTKQRRIPPPFGRSTTRSCRGCRRENGATAHALHECFFACFLPPKRG